MQTRKAKYCSWGAWNDPWDCPSTQKCELGHCKRQWQRQASNASTEWDYSVSIRAPHSLQPQRCSHRGPLQGCSMEDREGQGERQAGGRSFAPPAFTVTLVISQRDGGTEGGTTTCLSCQKSHPESLSICPTWQLKLQPPSVVLDQ